MQAKFEVTAKSTLPKEVVTHDVLTQLGKVKLCVQMLENKNGIDRVTGSLNTYSQEVTFVLFNGRNGPQTDEVDSENKKIIDLARSLDAKITKLPYEYSYWSKSQITLPFPKVDSMIEALSLLDDIPLAPRAVAKC